MRNRTRAIAAAAITVALAAGGTAAAASATDGKTGAAPHAKVATRKASDNNGDNDLASRLGVSPARLDSALRAAKSALARVGRPTQEQFYAALAHNLGIPLSRVQQAFPDRSAGTKRANPGQTEQQGHQTLAAAIARSLHLSTARVYAALRPLFAAGRADESSPVFAAAARSLGVTPEQLNAAVIHAKESLGGK